MPRRIAVLTSGGDAQGMNAAVRAVVRAGIAFGAQVYGIRNGYQGAVDGGDGIVPLSWEDVSGIQHKGGTVIGTARCLAFRERAGRRQAALHLAQHGIDRLVVIGGDGSLTGADQLAQEWPGLLAELVAAGSLDSDIAQSHPRLAIAGVVGSIDNDMVGTDMTIGADSALNRIVEAVDAISSTAASHQRTFVIEVMGRRCGYLALTAAIAGGCDFALIPEAPPAVGWQDEMCDSLRRARSLGRRDSIILVAEGACDRSGTPITADDVRRELEERLGEQARVTILGHVQRGGTPSAFDRSMATMMGFDAASALLSARPEDGPQLIGIHRNRVRRTPLMRSVADNRAIATMLDTGRYDQALAARGDSYADLFGLLRALSHPSSASASNPARIAILHDGGLAPSMNAAVRAAVRLGHDRGHVMLGIPDGFAGLYAGRVRDLSLADVEGWSGLGGAELGTRRFDLRDEHMYAVARTIEDHKIDALILIGGFAGYEKLHRLYLERTRFRSLGIPMVCVPATIDNNVPGSELAIGADTALNTIVGSIDRIKQSAMAANRCFVIETMGRRCGYLTQMAALSAGAEQAYLPESGIELHDLMTDVERMRDRFRRHRSLFLTLRTEGADDRYSTETVSRIFAAEGEGLFDVRTVVLGHVQQGGDPSPFDRVLAARLASGAIDAVCRALESRSLEAVMVGLVHGHLRCTPLREMADLVDWDARRPVDQWWVGLRTVASALAEPPALV